MAVKKKWICDGCDDHTETDLDSETSNFYRIKVTAGAWGEDFILCPDCHSKLLKQIDPTKWLRMREAAPSPYVR